MASLRCSGSASVARSFLQLATRSYGTLRPSQTASTQLDFLLPLATSRPSPRSIALPTSRMQTQSRLSRRSFTSTVPRHATACVQNPVKDEEGNDMFMEITSGAAKRLSEIMVKDNNPSLALRISVESGGCHGFQYLMSLVTIPPPDAPDFASSVNKDDSIFQYIPDDGTASTQQPRIVLDEPSLDLLKGSKVDFVSELIGSQFKIVDNPYATSSCGCGTSFDVKFD